MAIEGMVWVKIATGYNPLYKNSNLSIKMPAIKEKTMLKNNPANASLRETAQWLKRVGNSFIRTINTLTGDGNIYGGTISKNDTNCHIIKNKAIKYTGYNLVMMFWDFFINCPNSLRRV